ncbi:fish-egg lectin-like [Hyla sarda]|uniref:fish-egg lectin-like n=1 Tax=Hyla sarda TaxID=327740 RepID=UPI0024C2A4EE|nr:fish-egg lectin-like [Hyla sarda]
MIQILSLLLLCTGTAADLLLCNLIPGNLKQIDAGAGQVYGVNDTDYIFRLVDQSWTLLSGQLIHVSVGAAGVWGVTNSNTVFKYQDNSWVSVNGALKQIDAGGNKYVAGVNSQNSVYCLNQDQVVSLATTLTYTSIDGSLKYYSCGLYGCWGVNGNNEVFYRYGVQPTACSGTKWENIKGSLAMVEVGADGSVYGVSPEGDVYKRDEVSEMNPVGTQWIKLNVCGKYRHVSYDMGILWLIALNGDIYKCQVSCPC